MRSMKKYLLGAAVCLALKGFSQGSQFGLADVPDSIKKNADVIKRLEEVYFEVTDIDRASLKIYSIYTVVNSNGKEVLDFEEGSNKFSSLGDVEIKVFDSEGRQVQKYKKKDLATASFGGGLVQDGKAY